MVWVRYDERNRAYEWVSLSYKWIFLLNHAYDRQFIWHNSDWFCNIPGKILSKAFDMLKISAKCFFLKFNIIQIESHCVSRTAQIHFIVWYTGLMLLQIV